MSRQWRTAMRYQVDEDAAYQQVWLELQALSWNRPELRDRVARVNGEWRAVLLEAFAQSRLDHAIDRPLNALVSLVMTFNEGVILEGLVAVTTGHQQLIDCIDGWLSR